MYRHLRHLLHRLQYTPKNQTLMKIRTPMEIQMRNQGMKRMLDANNAYTTEQLEHYLEHPEPMEDVVRAKRIVKKQIDERINAPHANKTTR